MTGESDPLIGRELGGCRILERLGAGGMGTVYKAHHRRLDRAVAVKVLSRSLAGDPQYIEAFLREARAAAKLEHPRIVQVYDVGREDGVYFIVMQFIEGETAADRIQRKGRLEPLEALRIVRAVLDGLAEAHRSGIVHRDVKPSNILLGGDGSIRLADFGLATPAGTAWTREDGVFVGTPDYVSPEQAWGAPGDARSDLYSLGASYFHMLAGRPPFEGADAAATAMMHVNEPLPNIRRVNPEVSRLAADIIARLMAKRPEERYPSDEAAMRDLDAPGVVISDLDRAKSARELAEEASREPESLAVDRTYEPTASGARPDAQSPLPWDRPKVVFHRRSRWAAAAVAALFAAAGLGAYPAGKDGGWAGTAGEAALLLAAVWAAGWRRASLSLLFLAAGAWALYGAGTSRVGIPSLIASMDRRELLFWAWAACAGFALGSYRTPYQWRRRILWLCSAAGTAVFPYLFALPPERSWASFLRAGPEESLHLYAAAILAVLAAALLRIWREEKFSGVVLPLPLLTWGALAAYAAGALQSVAPPQRREPARRPPPVVAPPPAPVSKSAPKPASAEKPLFSGSKHVMVIAVSEESRYVEEPQPAPNPAPAAAPAAQRASVHPVGEPEAYWWEKPLLSDAQRSKLREPLRALCIPGALPRLLLLTGVALYALGLYLLYGGRRAHSDIS